MQLPSRPLGHSGIEVSVVGLGCNQFGRNLDVNQSRLLIDATVEVGITFLDTADIYGSGQSEEFLGQALRGRRDRAVIATKFGGDGARLKEHVNPEWEGPRGSGKYIPIAVESSLKRLGTDHIDLYWYHRPDGVTPILETLQALDQQVKSGKVRAIGASNFTAPMIEEADAIAREHNLTRFTAIQNHYNLLERKAEQDVLPLCERLDLAFIPYFPLAMGLLTGKYKRDEPAPADGRLANSKQVASDEQWQTVERLSAFAADHDVTLPALAIGGLLGQPAVSSVIAGATKPEQVRANAAAAQWIPDVSELTQLQQALA